MRRKDREITEFGEILQIVDACNVLRIGLSDGDYPYIVPVNFAYEVNGERLFLYIHGAQAGRKFELLRRNSVCSFEADIPLKIECLPDKNDVTMRYKSVMGKADTDFLDGEEKQRVMDEVIMARYPETKDFDYNRNEVPHTAVVRLTVTELTAKANLPGAGADI